MSSRDGNSSDLERARALSRRLSGESEAPAPNPPQTRFVRFSNRPTARAASPPAAAPAPSPAPAAPKPLPPSPASFESWDALLGWCLELARAKAAFVVDPEGFVIAHCGDWKFEHLEAVGSQLLDVKERAERIEQAGSAKLIALELESFSLSGMVFVLKGGGAMLVGFIDSKELGREAQRAIAAQVAKDLDRL
jgi:hypothetical protein